MGTTFNDIVVTLNRFVWGPWFLIPLLLGTGLYLTIRLRLLQLIRLLPAMRLAFIDRSDAESTKAGDISQFQALTTALAATVGVGNIIGVATAIHAGGPGALFWMWMTGLVGMATKYSEGFLAVRFRTTDEKGNYSGGPQYYLEEGIVRAWGNRKVGLVLALIFAVFATIASFGIGNMAQGNSVASGLDATFGVPLFVSGLIMAIIVAIVVIGGVKVIGKVTSMFVPVMIVFYMAGATWILISNASGIPGAFKLIFEQAFTGQAATGGLFGAAFIAMLQVGVARGVFSNESGMGSAPIAAAAAQTYHPVRQGMVSMTQTFIDTLVVVTFTGLVLITTGVYDKTDDIAMMTNQAFSHGLPGNWGGYIVTLGLVFFAFSTILGWAYYGERCMQRLGGQPGVWIYRVIFVILVFVGAITKIEIVWNFSDLANGLMAVPNLIGLLLLSGVIVRETRYYLKNDPHLKASKEEVQAFMIGQSPHAMGGPIDLERSHREHPM